MKGRLQVETVGSILLKGNPLGDPNIRDVPVYLPPSYEEKKKARYPVIYYLAGFTGTGRGCINHHPWKENVAERLERLILAKKAKECILVFPDCFTAYGGSQYVNSAATGRYEDHIVDEIVGYIDDKFRTLAEPASRALMGKSSGGFGTLYLGMRHTLWDHLACHSGDMLFEISYGADIPKFVNALEKFGGSAKNFVKAFRASKEKFSFDMAGMNLIGMASCYSPNAKNPMGFDLPFDERTGEYIPKVWSRWMEKDPIEMAPRYKARLKSLRTLYFDCGRKDEFYLHLGARKFSRVLKSLGVKHTYKEHGKGHMDMAFCYDDSLKLLSRALKR